MSRDCCVQLGNIDILLQLNLWPFHCIYFLLISCLCWQCVLSYQWESMNNIFYIFFQVVAITVYFLLCIAFYAFFSPFLGKDVYQYIAVGVYSLLVRCHPTHAWVDYMNKFI